MTKYTHTWGWRKQHPDRYGQHLRVIRRTKDHRRVWAEFADGTQMVIPNGGLREIGSSRTNEERREYQKQYYAKNREKALEYQRQYYQQKHSTTRRRSRPAVEAVGKSGVTMSDVLRRPVSRKWIRMVNDIIAGRETLAGT